MRDALEERIIRLEENAYFQEKTIKELHEALLMQQRQLDTLQKQYEGTQSRLRHLFLLMQEGGPENSAPPHYL